MPDFVVNVTDDTDDGACDAAHCSLREALDAAFWHAGPDLVAFNIPTEDSGYSPTTKVWTIQPGSGYGVPAGTTVDGSTTIVSSASGAAVRPTIELDGIMLASTGDGLHAMDGVTLRGLVVNRFGYGIWVEGDNVIVESCYVGTNATGSAAKPNQIDGILVAEGATGVTIRNNLISGNTGHGVRMFGPTTTGNTIEGNYIGTDVDGTASLPNGQNGIRISDLAHHNTIGPGNVVSFNERNGVQVTRGARANTITSNSITGNALAGILLSDGGNDMLAAPTTWPINATQVGGTACAYCTIEVFSDGWDEGALHEGTTSADGSGNWMLSEPGGFTGPYVTATATDTEGNTSEFSSNAWVPQPVEAQPQLAQRLTGPGHRIPELAS